jgi:hypothetical protein
VEPHGRVPALPLAHPRLRTQHFFHFILLLSLAFAVPLSPLSALTLLTRPLLLTITGEHTWRAPRRDDALQQHGPEQRRQQCRVALASRGIRILGRRGVLVARARPPEPHASPRSRYRVARVARRLLGLTERGLESEAAEEADAVEGRVQGQSKKGARKDRARLQKERVTTRTRVTRSATEEVWNPFAHLKDV